MTSPVSSPASCTSERFLRHLLRPGLSWDAEPPGSRMFDFEQGEQTLTFTAKVAHLSLTLRHHALGKHQVGVGA